MPFMRTLDESMIKAYELGERQYLTGDNDQRDLFMLSTDIY